MIRVGILDASELGAYNIAKNPSASVLERIEKTKSPKEKTERIAAYALLEKMYMDEFPESQMPEIIYTSKGKPYFFEDKGCFFSISHSDGVVSVAISDGEVGLDLQGFLENEVKTRVGARFGDTLRSLETRGDGVPRVTFSFFEVRDGEICEKDCDNAITVLSKKDADAEFSAAWTVLEAALKLDGGGFASISSLPEISKSAEFLTVKFYIRGKQFLLTVAAKRDQK